MTNLVPDNILGHVIPIAKNTCNRDFKLQR
jgi:hypothetical protein